MCFHYFDRSEPVHSALFGPLYSAQYVGNRRRSGLDDGWSRRPWYRHRPDEGGAVVEFRDGDYILVRWELGTPGQRSLYFMRADSDPEYIHDIGPNDRSVGDAIALHVDPERASQRIAERDAREAEERHRARFALQRSDLSSVVGELAPGTFFRDPDGRVGRLNNLGKRFATWRYLESAPERVEIVQLKRPPYSEALWSMRARGIVIDD